MDDIEKIKEFFTRERSFPDILDMERFLSDVHDKAKTLKFSEREKLEIAVVYHKIWWFRGMLIKRLLPNEPVTKNFEPHIFIELKSTAERVLNNELARDAKNSEFSASHRVLPRPLRKEMADVWGLFERKTSDANKNNDADFYIVKRGDDFFYKDKQLLRVEKDAEYYIVFCALYALRPNGGLVEYTELIKKLSPLLPKIDDMLEAQQRTYIQKRLTERGNYFQKYAELDEVEDNQKPLIASRRGVGIVFNNRKG